MEQERRRMEKQQALQNLSTSLGNIGQALAGIGGARKNTTVTNNNYNNSRSVSSNTNAKMSIPVLKATVADKKVTAYTKETAELDSSGRLWVGGHLLGAGARNSGEAWGVSSSSYKYFTIKTTSTIRLQYVYFFNK